MTAQIIRLVEIIVAEVQLVRAGLPGIIYAHHKNTGIEQWCYQALPAR